MVESANLEVIKYVNHNTNNYDFQVENSVNIDPYTMFLHAMKSPVTRTKYSRRLEMFFDFLKLPGETIDGKCLTFANNGRNNVNWVFSNILKFVLFHKERIHKKEISGATLINYLKAIKLFCEMSDISINWKKITRGLSRGKRYVNPDGGAPLYEDELTEDEKDYYEEYKPEKEETIEDWKNEVTTTEGEEATKQILAQQDEEQGYPVESSPTQTLNDSEESREEEVEDNSSEEEQQQEEEEQEEPEQEEESNEEESEEEDNSDSESESDE